MFAAAGCATAGPAHVEVPEPPRAAFELSTIPRHVYRTSQGDAATWAFHVVVPPAGAGLTPRSAAIELYAGAERVVRIELSAAALHAASGERFRTLKQVDEAFDLRHRFVEPAALAVDRMVYRLDLTTPSGEVVRASREIPVEIYQQKTKLSFPLKGVFVVMKGNFDDGGHSEWSQLYAYDIVGLGAHGEILVGGTGEDNADFIGWGREVLAPAAGLVVYARDDIDDNPRPGAKRPPAELLAMPDGNFAIGGNDVVIDHGNSEFSLLAHMQRGSLRVKTGDRVTAGQVLGKLGNSGNSDGPHLHYHLMAGKELFGSDGLPSRFEGLEMPTPRRGEILEAK
jgi:hypothetical protein